MEITADILLSGWESGGVLEFGFRRGNLGFSRVEISRVTGDQVVVVETAEWGGITGDGVNTHTFQVPVEDLLNAAP